MSPIDLSQNATDVIAASKDASPEDRAAALAEEQAKDSPRKTVVEALSETSDDPPAPGEVKAPNVPPAEQGAPGRLDPVPDSSDKGAAERSTVNLKRFVKSQSAPSDLFLVLDDVEGAHYFSEEAPAGKGAQLLAVKGQPVDDGISGRLAVLVEDKG